MYASPIMKILVVSPHIYPQGSGVGRTVSCLANELANLGIKLTVLTSGKRTANQVTKYSLIKKRPLFNFFNIPFRLRLFFDMFTEVKNNQYDVILAFSPVPYFVDLAAVVSKIFKLICLNEYNE